MYMAKNKTESKMILIYVSTCMQVITELMVQRYQITYEQACEYLLKRDFKKIDELNSKHKDIQVASTTCTI